MKRHIQLAKDEGLNWQAALIEDAQSDLKLVVKDAVLRKWSWLQTNRFITQIVEDTIADLESPTLKEKARASLLAFATGWYRKVSDELNGVSLSLLALIATVSNGKGTREQTRQLYRTITRNPPIRSPSLPQIEEYAEIAQPLQIWSKRYIDDHVKPLFEELSTSSAKDGYNSRVSLRNIAEMTVRYDRNMTQLQALRAQGVRLVWTSVHANCSKRCEPFQGRLWSLDGTSGTEDGIPFLPIERAMNVPYTTKAGKTYINGIISGYNCRHSLIPYQKGVRPQEVAAATVEKYREIDTTQRQMERKVRKYSDLAMMWKDVDRSIYKRLKTAQTAAYAQYRRFSLKNGVAYYPSRTELFPAEQKIAR